MRKRNQFGDTKTEGEKKRGKEKSTPVLAVAAFVRR